MIYFKVLSLVVILAIFNSAVDEKIIKRLSWYLLLGALGLLIYLVVMEVIRYVS